MDICQHTKLVLTRDVLSVILVLVTIFVVRELLTWYFKTNHILAKLGQILQKLDKL